MKKSDNECIPFEIGCVLLFVTAIVIVSSIAYFTSLDDQTITLDEKIVSGELIDGDPYGYFGSLLKIKTESGDEYIISTGKEIDLTVNSKLILELYNDGRNEVWEIKGMYKVPNE